MKGEGWGPSLDYFLYVLSESWPFGSVYLIAVVLISQLLRVGHQEDVIDR